MGPLRKSLGIAGVVSLSTLASFAQHGSRTPAQRPGAHPGPHPGVTRPANPQRKGPNPPSAPNPGPGERLERLEKMSPEQRNKALEKLPPDRRQRIERQIDDYSRLSPEERGRLNQRLERFRRLPPPQQNQVRQATQQLGQLPPPRQAAVRDELENLGRLPDSQRRERMNSDQFRDAYSPSEQKLMQDLSPILPEQF